MWSTTIGDGALVFLVVIKFQTAPTLKSENNEFSLLYPPIVQIVRLSIWHQSFLELWLVDSWFFAHPRDQRAVTRLEKMFRKRFRRNKSPDMLLDDKACWTLGERLFTCTLFWSCQNKCLSCILFMHHMLVGRIKNLSIMVVLLVGYVFCDDWYTIWGSEISIFYSLFTLSIYLYLSLK